MRVMARYEAIKLFEGSVSRFRGEKRLLKPKSGLNPEASPSTFR